MKTIRVSESLMTLPSTCRGIRAYHDTYAGSSHAYTMAWPVIQKSVRLNSGSTRSSQPSDQGSRKPMNETATPKEARHHMAYDATEMWASSGIRSSGCSLRQPRSVMNMFAAAR